VRDTIAKLACLPEGWLHEHLYRACHTVGRRLGAAHRWLGVTQSWNLDGAEQMVRDYIESLTGLDTSNDEITIKPEVGDGLDEATQAARDAEGYKAPMARDAGRPVD
jgi:hypothetical protein